MQNLSRPGDLLKARQHPGGAGARVGRVGGGLRGSPTAAGGPLPVVSHTRSPSSSFCQNAACPAHALHPIQTRLKCNLTHRGSALHCQEVGAGTPPGLDQLQIHLPKARWGGFRGGDSPAASEAGRGSGAAGPVRSPRSAPLTFLCPPLSLLSPTERARPLQDFLSLGDTTVCSRVSGPLLPQSSLGCLLGGFLVQGLCRLPPSPQHSQFYRRAH